VTLSPGLFSFGKLHRDVRLLIAMSGLIAISFMGIQNLVKVLYVLRLGYGLEYVGIFNATGAFAYMLMGIPAGILGNRLGPRLTIQLGGATTVLGMLLLPLTEVTSGGLRDAMPILSQAVMTGGWAMCGVNMVPALMGLTTPQLRTSAFAMNSVFRGIGTFAGTVVGGFLPGMFAAFTNAPLGDSAPYRWALWVAAGLGFFALIPLLQLGPIEGKSVTITEGSPEPFPFGWVVLLILYSYLTHGTFATCHAFCSAYMDTDLQLSPGAIGLIIGAGQFVAILAPLFVPTLAQRYSNQWVLAGISLGMGISLLPIVLWENWLAVGFARLGIVALDAMWQPSLQVMQMETVSTRWRSLAYGIFSMMLGLAFASVSLSGGYIVASMGYRPFFLGGVIAGVVGAVLMRVISVPLRAEHEPTKT
jgi:MFS family permease